MAMADPNLLITVRDVCDRYRVSKSKFYRDANAGHFNLLKYGRMTRVRVSEIEAWANSVFVEAANDRGAK
jgi:excisionase family DNA binding protein